MGLSSLPLLFLLAAAPPLESVPVPPVALPMTLEVFEAVLEEGGINELSEACADSDRFGLQERLRLLRNRLMVVAPAPQPFAVVMANARALMACRAPDSTQIVLSRFGPGPGLQRREWLLLSWQAASAALDQDRAVLALRRLADGDLTRLDTEQLIVGQSDDGLPLTRSALDLLANHELAAGRPEEAVTVLLAGRTPGVVASRRLGQVAELLAPLDPERGDLLLEAALDQAAAEQAWGLAEDLLRLQLRLALQQGGDADRPRERLRRLARRLDDRLTLLELEQMSPDLDPQRVQDLEDQLRSPRAAGGHASLGESDASEAPASNPLATP
ncbi:hypothetical protein WB44_08065 [Synechococcus sp. WH 8020]|uniref:hypothetical protein n=1 Tax=Synechococcus sp. (strain WH8020) TaxID=32052 RepID=UPI00065278E8|nr:hypothetical protein [Synechococcus sp. WH 8020]AKN61061.1 hypothetical protein WB44_08065 [Synechococcus sp. WH 8020]